MNPSLDAISVANSQQLGSDQGGNKKVESVRRFEFELQLRILRDLIGPLAFTPASVFGISSSPLIEALAQAAYTERNLPSGDLNPDRLAVLSDALEDAGCDNADILNHLREPGPHVRGCWAIDLLLGKS